MDIFDSPWLINMLSKCSPTPQGRLLGLFDILDDWLQAPTIEQPSIALGNLNPELISFCVRQAQLLDAKNPELLAEHIVLIAQNAARHALLQPGSNSLAHAKKVVLALIQAQTHTTDSVTSGNARGIHRYTIAASLLLLISVGTVWAPSWMNSQRGSSSIAAANFKSNSQAVSQNKNLTAIDAARMYARYEQMRQGTCQFPEALQIPDKHKSIYLDNVVGGKVPTDLADLEIANFYLEKVRCNFTPMLMATSK